MSFFINLIERIKNLLKKENIYFLTLALIIFFFDRASKSKIINDFNQSTYYINEYINFDLIWNIGIGFGFLSTDSSLIYNFISMIIGIVILYLVYIFIESEKLDKIIYSIIIGGALGNFYDRILYKAVPDFIDIHYSNMHWFTFNIADVFITIGILIFIIKSYFIKN
jgi:signal peptidase II